MGAIDCPISRDWGRNMKPMWFHAMPYTGLLDDFRYRNHALTTERL